MIGKGGPVGVIGGDQVWQVAAAHVDGIAAGLEKNPHGCTT